MFVSSQELVIDVDNVTKLILDTTKPVHLFFIF